MKFWKDFKDIHDKIIKEGVEISKGMKTIQRWLNGIYSKYTIVNFVADHACVDMAWFRSLFLTHCKETKFNLPYSCRNTDDMVKDLILLNFTKNEITEYCTNSLYPHTHYALDDAVQTGYEYLRLKQLFKKTVNNHKSLIRFSNLVTDSVKIIGSCIVLTGLYLLLINGK